MIRTTKQDFEKLYSQQIKEKLEHELKGYEDLYETQYVKWKKILKDMSDNNFIGSFSGKPEDIEHLTDEEIEKQAKEIAQERVIKEKIKETYIEIYSKEKIENIGGASFTNLMVFEYAKIKEPDHERYNEWQKEIDNIKEEYKLK